MGQLNLGKMLRLGYSLPKVKVKTIIRLFKLATKQLLLEISLAVSVIGFSYLFTSWGLPLNAAFLLAIGMILCLIVMAFSLFSEPNSSANLKGEVKLAQRIGQILTNRTSTEWDEYQDWLHDVMLSRQQLLDAKCPQWKVKLITYKRLSVFCIVVAISKVKQVTTSIWRSR